MCEYVTVVATVPLDRFERNYVFFSAKCQSKSLFGTLALTVAKWRSLTVLHERYVLKSLYEQL